MKRENKNILDFDVNKDVLNDLYDDFEESHYTDTILDEEQPVAYSEAFKVYFNKLLLACSNKEERDVLRECHMSLSRAFHSTIY